MPKASIKKQEREEKKQAQPSYSAKDIYVLEGLEPVRKRPGMYIGSTGIDGLHHLIWEVVDNSLDEAMSGYAERIEIIFHPQNRVSVIDDGRGIPVDLHPQTKKSALETVMCTLHAGGKFGGESYKISGGLHGVGVSVVNALSKYLRVEVCRDGFLWQQEYARGKPISKVEKLRKCEKRGTTVTFEPDPEIFPEIKFDLRRVLDHLREQAYLVKGTNISVIDKRDETKNPYSYTFYFEGGVLSYLKHLIKGYESFTKNLFYANKEVGGVLVEIALTYIDDIQSAEVSFANNIKTGEGGMHLTGFRSGLTRVLNDYAKQNGFFKKNSDVPSLTGDDVREGLVAVVSVKLREPQFEGQTKAKLGNPEARSAVELVMNSTFKEYLERNPNEAKAILDRVMLAAKARIAAKTAKESVLRKGIFERSSLPGILADCQTRRAAESELFIVEGQSAGGCFSGDTRVVLADGRALSFRELIKEYRQGKKNYCYTIKKDGSVGVAPIENPRKTGTNVRVVKVVLDNGNEIVCTPEHKFMLRDQSYKEAKDLNLSDSLMPFYFPLSEVGEKAVFKNRAEDQGEAISCLNVDKLNNCFVDNHKVLQVVPIQERMEVYDLEVPETHNFALAVGVFVHNSAKQGRDRRYQAILPLRGKPLNVEKARIDKMLANEEIRSLVVALGTAITDEFDIGKLRYHKIIIMTDADVDGLHIRTLLLTLFFRYFKEVIEGGYLYIAQPPLYRIQKGKIVRYAYSDEEKDKFLEEISKLSGSLKHQRAGEIQAGEENDEEQQTVSNKTSAISIQRYKGLGEMNPLQLWETTMNPESRTLKQVTIEDAAEADRLFDLLMGDEVLPRKKFIQAQATLVKELDV